MRLTPANAKPVLGARPDTPDHRDHEYVIPRALRDKTFPRRLDHRAMMPPVYDQRPLSSCTANAIAGGLWYERFAAKKSPQDVPPSPSRMFIYYNVRHTEKLEHCDSPVSLRDAYKSVSTFGVCSEEDWPYDFKLLETKPSAACFRKAKKLRVKDYRTIPRNLRHMKACLLEGHPFAIAISAYESILGKRTKKTGLIPMPKDHERCLGGHALLVVGYDDRERWLIIRNSWGTRWGHGGYGYLPYGFIERPTHSWNFWTARFTSSARL